ncbi:uncharacterized protein LACBIDRAFT_312711 [Laccaria bicolor S238N-H82]|uniref:Predicted protein n=1 Tax=Laccaria bicolor (strain S238N-H82 / ATCC MYA-4686) TaxID=486041 RepID=B0DWS5_LACBS|nr:uncharacterized protein LACBIDRAFT_312711 [Laccaria bicolor S238N-H82]EDR00945.1 predicted protein [Laccaria bicolor S238N-H82]|eukprot:XP_001888340.1 predicted protein [Laccaria bicolor S238N-H82]
MEDCSWTRSYDSYQLQPQRDLPTLPHSSWPSARDNPHFFGGYVMDSTATVESSHMQNNDSQYFESGATEDPIYQSNVTSPPIPSLPDGDYNRRGRQQLAVVSHPNSRARSVQPPRTFNRPSRPRSTTTVVSATGSSNVLPMQFVPFWDSHFLSQPSSTMDYHYSQSSPNFSIPILSNGDGRVDRMIPPQEDLCFTQNIGVALQPLSAMPDQYSQSYPTGAISTSPIRASRMTPWPEGTDFTQTNGSDSAVTHMAHPEATHFPPGQRPKIATEAVKKASERRRRHAAKFNCEWPGCVSDFTTKHNLQNHLNSHLGIRNYQCDVCKRTFGVAHVLTRHRKKCRATDSN